MWERARGAECRIRGLPPRQEISVWEPAFELWNVACDVGSWDGSGEYSNHLTRFIFHTNFNTPLLCIIPRSSLSLPTKDDLHPHGRAHFIASAAHPLRLDLSQNEDPCGSVDSLGSVRTRCAMRSGYEA